MKKVVLAVALLSACGLAVAKDYGVQGNVWPITEIDIRRLLLESAARTDWSAVNNQAKDSGKRYLQSLPKRALPLAEHTQTDYFDPSIELTSDIQAPVRQPDGSYQWQVLAAKGQKVNPLDRFRPTTAFFLFDGSQPDQIELLKKVLAAEPDRIVPVEAGGGDLKEMSDALKRPIFYASDAMITRFQVRFLPSLVYPGTGANARALGVTAFGLPFKAEEVINSWDELKPTPAPSKNTTKARAQ